jgi:hypothetical protein
MKHRAPLLALFLLAGALVVGFGTLYRLRLGRGDIFPPYSSLRSDPLGTRVLHESLASLGGTGVTRWMQPLDQLPALPARTIILAGLPVDRWKQVTKREFDALDTAVRNGSRLVVAFRASDFSAGEKDRKSADSDAAKKKEGGAAKNDKKAGAPEPDRDPLEDAEEKPTFVDLAQRWDVTLKERSLFGAARRGPLAPVELPPEVKWESHASFETLPTSAWRAMYRRGFYPVLIERPLGLGSIVLASDAYFLSNEALQRDRKAALLAWSVGALPQVEFVESHLGVLDDPGVAALARRYGLAGAFFTFLVLTALFVWRQMALFAPAPDAVSGLALEYNQTAGLEALLRRAVPPADLIKVCSTEWRATARPADVARVEAALAAAPKHAPPATLYNLVVRALRRR